MSTILDRVIEGHTYAGNTDLKVMTCPLCGVTYAIPLRLQESAYKRGEGRIQWFCPNGHQLGYHGEGDLERERRRAEKIKRELRFQRERAAAEADLRRDTERRLAAQKGATTRAKRRHAAAVCPCCNRSFVQLRRHMAAKHPDYDPARD